MSNASSSPPTRREFLVGALGGVGALGLAAGCDAGARAEPAVADASTLVDAADVPPADASGEVCTVYPQQTEGPYYLDDDLLRRDITEGRPGTPLTMAVRVVEAGSCAPLVGVAVDLWHCDAAGVYSGYPGQLGGLDTRGETFLRGTQMTDADGVAILDTIYPGWYPGRTTHIHVKLHPTPGTEATSQIYFPEDLTAAVYGTAPYAARGPKDTSNADDVVARGGLPPLPSVAGNRDGYLATLTIAVSR